MIGIYGGVESPDTMVQIYGSGMPVILAAVLLLMGIFVFHSRNKVVITAIAGLLVWTVVSLTGYLFMPDVAYHGINNILDFTNDNEGGYQMIVYSPTGMTFEATSINLTRESGRLYPEELVKKVEVAHKSNAKWGVLWTFLPRRVDLTLQGK